MTTPIKLMVTIVAILLAGAGFYLCDWSGKYQRRGAALADLESRRQGWRDLQAAIQEYPRVQQQVLRKQQQLDQVLASRAGREPADDFVPNYLGEVERRVVEQRDANFRILSISPSAASQPSQSGPFQTRVFSLTLRGSYATVVGFLYELSARKADRVLTINSLRLSQGDGSNLHVELPVTAYQK